MTKSILLLLLPLFCLGQSTDEFTQLISSSPWNIAYQVDAEGNRTDEEDEAKIRQNWVRFFDNGTYEMAGGVSGKIKGRWSYDANSQMISFQEGRYAYKAKVEEISDMNLLLHYVNDGGYKLGLIHHVYIPKEKSNAEISELLTSGKWLVTLKRYDGGTVDRVETANQNDVWYLFQEDGIYTKSEMIGEEAVTSDGTWFVDDKFNLNLDSGENTIYSVIGDKSKLILTTTSGGYNTIEMKKAKD